MDDQKETANSPEPSRGKSQNDRLKEDKAEVTSDLLSSRARILKETEASLQRGIALYKAGEDEEAADVLSEVLEARTKHLDNFDIECAAPHYYYGVALHEHAKATQDVFGSSSIDKGLQLGKEKTSEGIDAAPRKENEESQDDALSRAWESLEVAKLCYQNDGPEKHRDDLADVHGALADVCMETGRYEAGKNELCRAIDILKDANRPAFRKMCDLHFRCSLAEENAERYEEAKDQCCQALYYMKQEIKSKAAKLDYEDCNNQVEELEGILKDLEERMMELDDAICSKDKMQKMVREMFAGGLKNLKDSGAMDKTKKSDSNEKMPENDPEEITIVPRPKRPRQS